MTRRVSSDRLVGRDDQLDDIETLLGALVSPGQPSAPLLLIAGEAGIGKSRLLAELSDRARRRGAFVLLGRCLEHGSEIRPLSAVVEILAGLCARADDPDIVRKHGLEWLVDPRPGADQPNPAQMYEQIRAMLGTLARRTSLVVAIEDLHWADRTTCELLSVLVRARELDRVLVVCTYRSDELHRRHPLLPFLAELERGVRPERILLEPLETAAIGELAAEIVGAPVADSAARQLAERSGGNPFYAEEIVAAGLDRVGPPETVRQLILARSQMLGPAAMAGINAAATLAAPVRPDVLAATAGLDTESARTATDRLCAEGLLVADTGGFRFRHDLVREVFIDELLPGERSAIFKRAGDALEQHQPDRLGEIAVLRFRAAMLPEALRASVEAGDAASSIGAAAEAAADYSRALDIWERVDDAEGVAGVARFDLLRRAARACDLHRDFDRAVDLARRAVAEVEGADPHLEGLVLDELCLYLWDAGAPGLDDVIERALAVLPESPPSLARARVEIRQAGRLRMAGDYEGSRRLLERAARSAESLGSKSVQADAAHALAFDRAVVGDRAAVDDLREAMALAAEGEDPRIAVKTAINLMSALVQTGYEHEATPVFDRGIRVCERHGLTPTVGLLLYGNMLEALHATGRWEEAGSMMRGIEDRFTRETLDLWASAFVGWGEILIARGCYDDARPLYVIGIDQYHSGYYSGGFPQVCHGYIQLAAAGHVEPLTFDDLDAMIGHLESGEQLAVSRTLAMAARLMVAPDGPAAERAAARSALAAMIDDVRRAVERHYVSRPPVLDLWLDQTAVELAEVDGLPATRRWSDLGERWRAWGRPFEAATAEFRSASALLVSSGGRRSDDRAEASRLLRSARSTAATLDATVLLQQIDDLARRARLRLTEEEAAGAGTETPDPFGLTEREREVLELVVAGRSNGEIGSELFIATKTASVHVSNILRKLRAANRIEAAAIARRHGLGGDERRTDQPSR